MEHLFKQTELEVRFAMNMNVLDSDGVPRVMSLKEVLAEFLKHRHNVLVRRVNYRLDKINSRLEILSGYLIAYLNLDEIIRIIREEEDPKTVMVAKFSLTDNQAEAILNMKLRNLRKLEESEIRKEFDDLTAEKGELEALLADEKLRWQAIAGEIKLIRENSAKRRRSAAAGQSLPKFPMILKCRLKPWWRKSRLRLSFPKKGGFVASKVMLP